MIPAWVKVVPKDNTANIAAAVIYPLIFFIFSSPGFLKIWSIPLLAAPYNSSLVPKTDLTMMTVATLYISIT
jgi:hypothetical protein